METHVNALAKIAALAVPLSLAAAGAQAQSLSFWTMEEQPERLARQEAMAKAFTDETGIEVEIIPVSESDLGKRATAAFAADDLPDVVYFSLQYMQPWAEAGILDIDSNTEAVEDLGADTFAPGALEMTDIDGDYAAVPLDGGDAGLKRAVAAVKDVSRNPGWLIFYGHDIRKNPSDWGCTPEFLDVVLHAVEQSGAQVRTQSEALKAIQAKS